MSSVNLGGQIVTYKYGQEATSETFNRLFVGALPQGIYDGALLSDANPATNRVTIGAGVYIFEDPLYTKIVELEPYVEGVAVKVQQTQPISDFQISTINPYVIASYSWENVEENYITFSAASLADINTLISSGHPPIVIGRAVFIDGVLQTGFDYTRRSIPYLAKKRTNHLELRVQSDQDGGPSGGLGVYVTPGNLVINNRKVAWAGGYYNPSPAIPATTQQRVDLIYLAVDGTIKHRLGTEHPSAPQAPRYPKDGVVLAEIRRGQNRTNINGSEIFNIDPERYVTADLVWGVTDVDVNAKDIPIGDAINQVVTGGTDITLPNSTSVQVALQTLVDRFHDMSGVADGSILVRHLGFGIGGGAISAVDIPIEDAANRYSGNNVEAALTQLSNESFTFYGDKTFNSQVTAPSFNATSLRSLKENIRELEQTALSIIEDTSIFMFNFKADPDKKQKVGFMADETHPLLSTEERTTMDVTNSIGVLIKAVQELAYEVKRLNTRVSLLEIKGSL